MMIQEKRPQSGVNTDTHQHTREAGCIYALITDRRSVSRRNRASWYLGLLNKFVRCDQETSSNDEGESQPSEKSPTDEQPNEATEKSPEPEENDISLISMTTSRVNSELEVDNQHIPQNNNEQVQYLVTPNTRATFLSKSIATSIILDLSPSVVAVSPQNGCVFLDSMYDALKRVLQLLVRSHDIPCSSESKTFTLVPKVFVSVIAYTPFVIAKNNQVLIQNRRISAANIDQVLVEIWICLMRLTQEIHELVGSTCGMNLDFDTLKPTNSNVFVFPQPVSGGVIRHPGSVLEDIYELGLFSSILMPRLCRLSLITISDGLFASTNNLNIFRLKSIAVSFVSLGAETSHPDACFGYTPYIDLMKFTAKTTQGVYLSHQDLIDSSESLPKIKNIPLLSNPFHKLFCWAIHSEITEEQLCNTPRASNFHKFDEPAADPMEVSPEHVARFFRVDQPIYATRASTINANSQNLSFNTASSHNYHDWRSFRQLDRNLDADFEQVLSCLLREGYLIKSIQLKHKDTSRIVARLILHWRHNLDLEQELTAPYWNHTDFFDMSDSNKLNILRPFNAPLYGDTYCELIVHGSYSFLHNLYCDRRTKRRSEYRDIAYRQFRQLIDGVLQTHERLQYLSRFYRDSSLSKVPSFLLHGNSLLYEQPHTHKLTSTIENVLDEAKISEFQEYWQKISCLDTRSWKNLMHIHTLRLVLEHDQPKHKNIHYQNANGRYTHVQCRRALSAISNFIKGYASFGLLEDTTYIKFIYNKDDDLREIETSATKGFIVIRINKLLPIIVINLMFTSGILDSHRVQIVSYIEDQLVKCKLRNMRTSAVQMDNILKSKTISPSSESCCILIKSPLERMLKVYSRNFINEFLIHNWSYGLPGSCPYNMQQQSIKVNSAQTVDATSQRKTRTEQSMKEEIEGYSSEISLNRYNLIFGKYLYGVRVVHTITNLPHEIVPSLAANVLSKISAILVNVRIKQGFHIAFNNSGILNLVVELAMKDHSNEDHVSSCLCQYIVFPPTLTNCPQTIHSVLGTHSNGVTSKPGSLTGSLANSDSYMKNPSDSNPHMRVDSGELKIIKEYWIEQQYGLSSQSGAYHQSLQDMRYSEMVDHLFITDSSIFDCLLTYDLLQLWCDKLSLYHDLDSSFIRPENRTLQQIFSPTSSTNSSNLLDHGYTSAPSLPSTLIEGNTKDGNSKVPLIEMEYKFSLTKFLDHCQQASLNVLLFKDSSEFYEPPSNKLERVDQAGQKNAYESDHEYHQPQQVLTKGQHLRKMSMDMNDLEGEYTKREHRSSYQHAENMFTSSQTYTNPIYSPSLNHLFLETLHKRLKQMHDKELKLSDYDRKRLPMYLKRRKLSSEEEPRVSDISETSVHLNHSTTFSPKTFFDDLDEFCARPSGCWSEEESIDWRCFLRKGNQENLMIVLVPATLSNVTKWLNFANHEQHTNGSCQDGTSRAFKHDPVCPLFVFRCSTTMINDHVLSFLRTDNEANLNRSCLESDLSLHFGKPCNYMGCLKAFNDELNNEILPLTRFGTALNQNTSDEKTLEVVHFRAFLRKIKNTVLKSRFSSLNDAYLSELFVHKDDILYYINNVDMDTQKKYHVSTQLRSLADFIKSYEEHNDSLPKEPVKPCNKLLNSIILQKCGLFINQPIARFNESNPLIKQLHDKKLLFLMRCNYKVELPILEENLANSTLLKAFIKPSTLSNVHSPATLTTSVPLSNSSINENALASSSSGVLTSSLGKTEGSRLMEMKCGSVGASASPSAIFASAERHKLSQAPPRFGSTSTLNSVSNSVNESFILEAFRGSKCCSIKDVPSSIISDPSDVSLRHEAHLAEVLKRTGERKESHHYRRVLKSKGNYNQSHSAIDQALKRVDSLGRLEHFCLTPLLFSPAWRSKLAPVRDHTLESNLMRDSDAHYETLAGGRPPTTETPTKKADGSSSGPPTPTDSQRAADSGSISSEHQQEADELWHQMVCNNYIKEYEQYIQTLGFNSVQIRYQSSGSKSGNTSAGAQQTASGSGASGGSGGKLSGSGKAARVSVHNAPTSAINNSTIHLRRASLSTSTASLLASSAAAAASSAYNTGYLIKFLNSGCLVFKVGFCKPYVYSILYSIEGERFNNSNMKLNMTAFLDELDNIKVTMHLHSFTYDYHLRSMYSYISGRQLTFSPGYHLISFLDEFRKYYQKAPNYARNHILSGEVCVSSIKVSGQQLYNYIVTHNTVYDLEVLEMSSSVAQLLNNLSSRTFIDSSSGSFNGSINSQKQPQAAEISEGNPTRSHANDYVLIELKREKVRYRDGKDPDIFNCGLLITHDISQASNGSMGGTGKNCLILKYFLLLTNQRDLYPKLIHTYDNIISLGCHRPIRLGVAQLKTQQRQPAASSTAGVVHKTSSSTIAPSSGQSDQEDMQSSELQSSGEMSGPQSIISTANSTQTSSSGLQFGPQPASSGRSSPTSFQHSDSNLGYADTATPVGDAAATDQQQQHQLVLPAIALEESEEAVKALKSSSESSTSMENRLQVAQVARSGELELKQQDSSASLSGGNSADDGSPSVIRRRRNNSTNSSKKNVAIGNNAQERTICDEEITYLGYFSSDEMDMLKFLQEKTANLRSHIEQIVRLAEIHYRRDYLWHKLMQRTSVSNKSEEIPLTAEELTQLLAILEAIDLASLDPQLSVFKNMHLNWYLKLLKAFTDLKQSSHNQHRIHTIQIQTINTKDEKEQKTLLLYIDPKCTTSFILLTVVERGSVELSMMLKDKQECSKVYTATERTPTKSSTSGGEQQQQSTSLTGSTMELDQDCQQLVNDFINFCATFMWSTFLT